MLQIVAAMIVLAAASFFIAGVVLVFRGDGTKFRLRQCVCGYSLHGLPRSVDRCPECGGLRETNRKSCWIRGDRVIIYGIICLIIAIVLGPLAVAALVYIPALR